jgi:hypothetical protein
MLKSLAVASLALLVLVPVASAQLEGTSSLTLGGLPSGAFETNETLAAFPFTVQLQVNNMVCVGSGAVVTVSLSAETESDGAGNFTTQVTPSEMRFNVPAGNAQSYSQTQAGAVQVRPDVTFTTTTNATTNLVAQITGISGCPGIATGEIRDEAAVPLQFQRTRGSSEGPGAQLPGPGLPLVALAVLGTVLVLRRKA